MTGGGTEADRIRSVYRERARRMPAEAFFRHESLAHVLRKQARHAATLRLLASRGVQDLSDLRILDVGCGDGGMLRQLVEWGARPPSLAGVDVREEPLARARDLAPSMDLRQASAEHLPWRDGSFDVVCQHTVFTSILDSEVRRSVAGEMDRVLRPGGGVLWYDFMYDNPSNPDVRGVPVGEIRQLFPGYEIDLRRITPAPPLIRRIPRRLLPILHPLLASIPPLCTHYLGWFVKPSPPAPEAA